eukprot:TRINITY_DN4826_c0_g1_i1.p1 TRINITY_DN4826_c0_g1~~TRINITY_DN4826_c0_g1_i1.p1  ORF type:complete len:145 (+),score=55.07 TRINITY_DN4826_c0_g1_i1:139-573(+)
MASPDVLWQILRSNSSFLVKRNGAQFSSEPGNLFNQNSFKYSGLANKKAISLTAIDGGAVSLGIKRARKSHKPSHTYARTKIGIRNIRKAANAIVRQTQGNHYRPDLVKAALARLTRLHRNAKVSKKKAQVRPKGKKRGLKKKN